MQALYAIVFITRYIDLLAYHVSLYNTAMKIFFIFSSLYILYLMKFKYRPLTESDSNPPKDTFRFEYLVGPAAILALIFNYQFTLMEILWAFSIYLEAVAIVPQLFMLLQMGEAGNFMESYVATLAIYRASYVLNWIYRYQTEGTFDPIAAAGGLVQMVLYTVFFAVCFTRRVFPNEEVPLLG